MSQIRVGLGACALLLALSASASDDQVGSGHSNGGTPCGELLEPLALVEFEDYALFNPCMMKGFRIVRTACEFFLAVEMDCLLVVWLDPGPPPRGTHDTPAFPPIPLVVMEGDPTVARLFTVDGREQRYGPADSGVYFRAYEDGTTEKLIVIEGRVVGRKLYP